MLEAQITKVIGSLPLGDPDQMRQRAAVIDAQAEVLAGFAVHIQRTIAQLTFEGRAANRMRSHLEEVYKEAERTADRIRSLAAYLLRAAGSTEAAQSDWHRRFRAMKQRVGDAVDFD